MAARVVGWVAGRCGSAGLDRSTAQQDRQEPPSFRPGGFARTEAAASRPGELFPWTFGLAPVVLFPPPPTGARSKPSVNQFVHVDLVQSLTGDSTNTSERQAPTHVISLEARPFKELGMIRSLECRLANDGPWHLEPD
ncbi:hypothetical protein [Methylobacterium sp. ID0610]|uniref:hypothetical protein n=1 Tax=Methylobacterium carpenticola TaxID=3344827 RepID=UPI0036A374F6